jgi:phosphoribosyl 1,2-cyclic phosphodiesterase
MLFSPLCSGSSGNASYLEAGGVRLLIDAGVTAKRLREIMSMIDLTPDGLDAILVTHEHSDHVSGIGVLSRKYDIPVYAAAECWENMPRASFFHPARRGARGRVRVCARRKEALHHDRYRARFQPHDRRGRQL